MATAVFDTLKASDTLKAELIGFRAELKQEIASLRADIAIVKGDVRLLKWMIGVVLACVVFPILKSFLL